MLLENHFHLAQTCPEKCLLINYHQYNFVHLITSRQALPLFITFDDVNIFTVLTCLLTVPKGNYQLPPVGISGHPWSRYGMPLVLLDYSTALLY